MTYVPVGSLWRVLASSQLGQSRGLTAFMSPDDSHVVTISPETTFLVGDKRRRSGDPFSVYVQVLHPSSLFVKIELFEESAGRLKRIL